MWIIVEAKPTFYQACEPAVPYPPHGTEDDTREVWAMGEVLGIVLVIEEHASDDMVHAEEFGKCERDCSEPWKY